MSRMLASFVLVVFASAPVQAQVQRARPTTGPSAASLATPNSGALKYNPRVLRQERAAAYDANPITRGASWRYRYSSPFNGYSSYYGFYGFRGYRAFGWYGGGSTLGWWGPY